MERSVRWRVTVPVMGEKNGPEDQRRIHKRGRYQFKLKMTRLAWPRGCFENISRDLRTRFGASDDREDEA